MNSRPAQLVVLLLTALPAGADFRLRVTGDWDVRVDDPVATEQRGQTIRSPVGGVVLEVLGDGDRWRVDVRRDTLNWHPDLKLFIRRVPDKLQTLHGGESFVPVEVEAHEFLSGTTTASNIRVEYKITGLTAEIPQGDYFATLHFTLTEE